MNRGNNSRVDYEQLAQLFEKVIPFNAHLGVKVIEIGDGHAVLELPFRPHLVGNPITKVLHGGVISSLLDNCGGVAVWSQIGASDLVSTVDLRVDYLRPAQAMDLRASGSVVRLGNRVGVVELRAYHGPDQDRPVAAGTGVYNIRRMTSADGAPDLWKRLAESEI
jgi:uncharacterized protein (TIGR00369 family)